MWSFLSGLKVFSRLVSFGLWSLLLATFCGGCLPQIIWLGLKSNHKLLCIYFGDLLTANQCQKFQLHWNHNKEHLVKITRQKIYFIISEVQGIDSWTLGRRPIVWKVFIQPRCDHSLRMSVTTDSLTTFWNLTWCQGLVENWMKWPLLTKNKIHREGWLRLIGWIFGKVPRGGGHF